MSEDQKQRFKPQAHLKRLRKEAETRKIGPDGKCAGTAVGDKPKGDGGVVSFAERTGLGAGVAAGQKLRVLLIEPDADLGDYVARSLKAEGYAVTVADHPDGRAMYQPGVETDIDGEFPLFHLILWDHPKHAIENRTISYSAPDPVSAMRFNNKQNIPTVVITDMNAVKVGMEDRKRNNLIAAQVIVLDREKMDLTSAEGKLDAYTTIKSALHAAIARANPIKGKGR